MGGARSSGRQKIESKRNNQKERGEENVSDKEVTRVLSRRVVYILDYSLCSFKFGYNTRRRNAPLGSRFHINFFNHTELEIRKIHDQGRQPQMSMIQLQKKNHLYNSIVRRIW